MAKILGETPGVDDHPVATEDPDAVRAAEAAAAAASAAVAEAVDAEVAAASVEILAW